MPAATITITDHTKAAQSLDTLLYSGSQTGYTVAPAAGYGALPALKTPSFLSIQASKGNTTNIVYVGDEKTANDGSRQGRELGAGDVMQFENDIDAIHLAEIYIRANADNVKVNVEWHFN